MFHDVVFMDVTYNTNQLGLTLVVISGILSEGKNGLMGFAFMARETTDNYVWLLSQLRDMNGGIEPNLLMTDFDIPMCSAIERVF